MDKMSGALVNIFQFFDFALPLIKVGIKVEVDKTSTYLIAKLASFVLTNIFAADPGTLLRSNTMTSKMMTAYSRLIAKKYLQDTLRDGIEKVCKFKKGLEVHF